MYLRIGSFTRPFNEATASITYQPQYDARNRVIAVKERWAISGRIVLQTNATQSRMTAAIRTLSRDANQVRPDLVFIEDDGVTETALALRAADCVEGPNLISASFPDDSANVYATGVQYGLDYEAMRVAQGSGSDIVTEFQETVANPSGGEVRGYVGGAINFPELQRFRQHAPFEYTQSGTAVGMYGYPIPPLPLWPQFLLRKPEIVRTGPEINGPIPMYFRVDWSYSFGSPFELFGNPHILGN